MNSTDPAHLLSEVDTATEVMFEASDAERLVKNPVVSVLMITYNHEEYIGEAIESIVSQECGFEFELIIGEDCSKDRTREIALEYRKKYPNIIRVIYSSNNVGMIPNGQRIIRCARGEYLAFCEGDDYWCAPNKLSRQVEMIQADPEVSIVHTDWVRSRKIGSKWAVFWGKSVHSRVPLDRLEGNLFATFYYPKILRTCTILLRRSTELECIVSGLWREDFVCGDAVLSAYVCSIGKVAYLPAITAVYRESPNSVLRSGLAARLAFLKSSLTFDDHARDFFSAHADYPKGYRWEMTVGFLLWSLKARDLQSARFALADILSHFSVSEFIRTGWRSLRMRRPTLRRQPRTLSALRNPPVDGCPIG
jgi:glycosyltransferase involved in cell wall biosynthesis